MRKLTLFACMMGLLAVSVSCKDDDSGDSGAPANTFAYNGKNYTPTFGGILDWGPVETHYGNTFFVTDGDFNSSTEEFENLTFEVSASLFSSGNTSFKTGTFNYINLDEATNEDIEGKNVFSDAEIGVDANSDGDIADDEYQYATAGKIIVSGTKPNYSFEVDLTLENGKTIKGKYTTAFEIYNLGDFGARLAPGSQLRTKESVIEKIKLSRN